MCCHNKLGDMSLKNKTNLINSVPETVHKAIFFDIMRV